MPVFLAFVFVIVVGLAVAGVLGKFGARLEQPVTTSPFEPLPERRVMSSDIDELRFDQTLRGYRPSQVEDVIDRLRDELAERDDEIALLHEQLGQRPGVVS